ncbi:MAG: lipopolysaccharide biosynthesis protein, partial [Chloroflexi bacterium]
MEEEIDLRQYVEVLIRYWMWIAGLALLAAVAAFVVSLLLPETYRVQSTVTVIRSRT